MTTTRRAKFEERRERAYWNAATSLRALLTFHEEVANLGEFEHEQAADAEYGEALVEALDAFDRIPHEDRP